MSIIIITDVKKLNGAIKSIKTSGAKFEAALHSVAYSCLARVEENGDIRPLAALYDALGGRVLKTALVAWSNAFGRVKMTEATETEAFTVAYAKSKPGDLASALVIPVSDYKPEVTGAGALFDLAAKLTSTIKAAGKAELTDDETKALALVTQALAMLNPAVVPASNVVPIKTPKARKPKAAAPAVQGDLALAS